ncbi:MAG TPA: delta-60 repeat domain-containing protein, partial [Gammaproteobacteria bacterium]|nr:delta-60 repeat domain-containing protein [Gammaproteobacteria bacterium]
MKCLRFVLPILAAWALGGAIAPAFATTLGQFDPAFNGGTPATLFDGDGNEIDAVAAAINPVNGDILWAGSGGSAPTHGGIVAYKPDGTVDSSVGSDGLILVSPTAVNYPSDNLVLTDIAVDGAGRILVSGIVKDTNNILLLARFNPDGSPDTGFGTAGTGFVVVAPSESAASGHDLALTADGHIMVVGVVSTGGTRKVAVWQFGPDGTIDADFGDAGHVRVDSLDGFALVFGCASVLEPNAELIIACRMGAGGFKIVRLHADGSPDTAFGDDGLVSVGSQYMNSLSLALVPGGGLAVAYSYHDIAGTLRYLTRLRRYLPDGSPDPGFNDGSAVTVTNTTTGCVVEVAAQPDGKLLLTTNCFFSGDILLARVLPDGSLDAAFGTDSFPGFADVGSFSAAGLFGPIPMAIAIQADGRIVIVGNAENSSSVSGIFTTRLLNDAFDLTPDTPAFDAVGRASLDQAVVSNAVTLGSVSIGDETDGIALALMVKGGQYSTTGSDGPFTGDAGSSNIA